MIHKAREVEQLYIRSMGKSLRVLAITNDDGEANRLMVENDNLAVIACFGPFVLLADKYDKGI